jgi:excisionase family DNA binding protein
LTTDDQSLELLTAKEVADILRLNPQVVLRKLQAGDIPGFKLGKDWRISRKQLLGWLELQSNQRRRPGGKLAAPFFTVDGRLKSIPAQRKKRVAVLEVILQEFKQNRVYAESDVNEIIQRFHSDFCTIRREFIMEQMMVRKDGKYKLNSSYLPRGEHML